MQHADSTARTRPSQQAILRALEKLAQREKSRRATPRKSGFYPAPVVVDEFAGLDRLDREELDEGE
jgi:hypothetical protein